MARTVSQLATILGSSSYSGTYRYIDPQGDFKVALAQVLPRLFQMGIWKDMTYELSVPNTIGYISLPDDTEGVLGVTLNNYPVPARSIWHDYRISGRLSAMPGVYGIVDAGFYPVLLDMAEVQGVAEEDVVALDNVGVYFSNNSPVTFDDLVGALTITATTEIGDMVTLDKVELGGNTVFESPSDNFTQIDSITYDGLTVAVQLRDPNFPDTVIANIPVGSGVVRFRRFRTSRVNADSFIHLLVKRAAPENLTDDTVIYLSNIAAIKHGLLGVIAEDNADLDRADRHWKMAKGELDKELEAVMGLAKPTLTVDLSGCKSAAPIRNFY